GQLSNSVGTLYTTPANTTTLVASIQLANATGSPVTGIKLYLNGSAAADQLPGTVTLGANGSATLDQTGLKVFDATGAQTLSIPLSSATPQEIADSSGSAGTATDGSRSDHVHAHGNRSGGSLHAAAVAAGAAGFMTGTDKTKLDGLPASAVPTSRTITTTAPVTIDGGASADLSANRTLAISAATTSTSGSMSAADKIKADAITAYPKLLVRVASTANVNTTSAPSSIDGITLASGNRVLLWLQSTGAENGIYVFSSAGAPLTRATDLDASNEITSGSPIQVREGN